MTGLKLSPIEGSPYPSIQLLRPHRSPFSKFSLFIKSVRDEKEDDKENEDKEHSVIYASKETSNLEMEIARHLASLSGEGKVCLPDEGGVMPFYPLGDMADYSHHKGAVDISRVLKRIGGILIECHAKGIFHRDVKPENILIASPSSIEGSLVLADFGLSSLKRYNDSVVGTQAYMPPDNEGEVDAQAHDAWALGITLLHLLFRKLPFKGPEDPNLADFKDDPLSLFDIYPALSKGGYDVLMNLLHADPEKRSIGRALASDAGYWTVPSSGESSSVSVNASEGPSDWGSYDSALGMYMSHIGALKRNETFSTLAMSASPFSIPVWTEDVDQFDLQLDADWEE